MSLLLILAWTFPLILALGAWSPRLAWGPALGPIPALCTALLVPIGTELEVSWLLTGAVFGLDPLGRTFLLFTAILWLSAGFYATASLRGTTHRARFNCFFLLAMAGNLWLILGQDVVSFYAGFTLMGIASYGLVVHEGDRDALRAGRVYLVLTLFAEVVLFMAMVLIVTETGTVVPTPEDLTQLEDLTIGLLILGLAVKAGLVPLHVWLPLAHPAAPIPASAVLSGAMIKVALLGWLRFLPIGEMALPGWGLLFVLVGLTTAFFAVPIGLVQSNPKVLLAYSSVSKMGLMVVVVGAALLEPAIAGAVVIGIGLYAGHHALSKGGLFLGVGLRKSAPGPAQGWVFVGLLVLALSMAAVPLTGGAVAKYGIKPAFVALEWTWLRVAVALTTMATAAMMARFLWVMAFTKPASAQGAAGPSESGTDAAWASSMSRRAVTKSRDLTPLLAWSPLIILVLLYPLVFGSAVSWTTDVGLIVLSGVLLLPIILVALRRPTILASLRDSIPPGDLLGLVRPLISSLRWSARWGARRAGKAMEAVVSALVTAVWRAVEPRGGATSIGLDQRLTAWPLAGSLWLIIMAGLILLAILWPTLAKQPQTAMIEHPPGTLESAETANAVGQSFPEPLEAGSPLVHRIPQLTDGKVAIPPETEDSAASPVPDSEVAQHTPETVALTPAEGSPAVSESMSKPVISDPGPLAPVASELPSPRAPDPCDLDERYHLTDGIETTLELAQCRVVDGVLERIDAPTVSSALLRLVQARLNALGFSAGPVDGLDGPLTRGAIRRFQSSIGMEADGIIDFALLDQLQHQPVYPPQEGRPALGRPVNKRQ